MSIFARQYLIRNDCLANLFRICQVGKVIFAFVSHKKIRLLPLFLFKNERKLHSLLSPLNLNLNYENFVFDTKVLLLFELTKYFGKKMQNFFIFLQNIMFMWQKLQKLSV